MRAFVSQFTLSAWDMFHCFTQFYLIDLFLAFSLVQDYDSDASSSFILEFNTFEEVEVKRTKNE